jgi:hypothetical protein
MDDGAKELDHPGKGKFRVRLHSARPQYREARRRFFCSLEQRRFADAHLADNDVARTGALFGVREKRGDTPQLVGTANEFAGRMAHVRIHGPTRLPVASSATSDVHEIALPRAKGRGIDVLARARVPPARRAPVGSLAARA